MRGAKRRARRLTPWTRAWILMVIAAVAALFMTAFNLWVAIALIVAASVNALFVISRPTRLRTDIPGLDGPGTIESAALSSALRYTGPSKFAASVRDVPEADSRAAYLRAVSLMGRGELWASTMRDLEGTARQERHVATLAELEADYPEFTREQFGRVFYYGMWVTR